MHPSTKRNQQLVFHFDSTGCRTNGLLCQLLEKVGADLTPKANLFTLLINIHGMQLWERTTNEQLFGLAHNILNAWTDHDTIPFANLYEQSTPSN